MRSCFRTSYLCAALFCAPLFCVSCDSSNNMENSGQKEKTTIRQTQESVQSDKNKTAALVLVSPSSMNTRKAQDILEFHNTAIKSLESGYNQLALHIVKNSRHYLQNWNLPDQIKPADKDLQKIKQVLTPDKAIFDDEEEILLTEALDNMDKALRNMFENFRKLEKYIDDDSILDEGKLGKELTDKIFKGNDEYLAARNSYLEKIEDAAYRAESSLLENEPLQRQILAARQLFVLINQTANLNNAESLTRDDLGEIYKAMQNAWQEGDRPPFPAAPNLERLYRAFLKHVQKFMDILQLTQQEGMFNFQKKELISQANLCKKAYNSFAEGANSSSVRKF